MFVDVSDLIMDYGVTKYIDFYPRKKPYDTGDYGVVLDNKDDDNAIKNVPCLMVEQSIKSINPANGTYMSSITYDFYLPSSVFNDVDMSGGTIISGNDNYIVTEVCKYNMYTSHIVVNATKEVMPNAKI